MPALPATMKWLTLNPPEVLEPARLKHVRSPAPNDLDLPARARYLADARRANAAQLLRQLRRVARADGEEQLEIFAAVERERKRLVLIRQCGFQQRLERQESGLDARADAALAAQVREVGRKAVAQVNHRRGETTLADERAPLDARRGSGLTPDESSLRAREFRELMPRARELRIGL